MSRSAAVPPWMLARPKLRGLRRADLRLIHGLGATSGMMTTLFPAAIFGVRQTTGHMSWDVVLASIARDDTAADPDVVP
ncbi:hypothetical protein G6034_13530 [Arthrobacter sp. AETb3-4]|uniref:MFS transporter n=1 Tax=Arthrobacter wenxiniae TaxID=2713570 RepID=A0A7Y7M0N7_9MICC|nr:hypothetical protein [Arthrobacter wenxiniae]